MFYNEVVKVVKGVKVICIVDKNIIGRTEILFLMQHQFLIIQILLTAQNKDIVTKHIQQQSI